MRRFDRFESVACNERLGHFPGGLKGLQHLLIGGSIIEMAGKVAQTGTQLTDVPLHLEKTGFQFFLLLTLASQDFTEMAVESALADQMTKFTRHVRM